ncbi:MAG: hypothetical protein ACLTE2_10345 [Eubacteriales bacterium]
MSEWVDTEGYLKEEFYQDKLSQYDLEQIGVQSLINNFGENERTARINQLQTGFMTRTVTGFRDMVTDGVNVVGYFEVDGRVAVCVQHSVTTPGLGSSTGTPVESFNQGVKKSFILRQPRSRHHSWYIRQRLGGDFPCRQPCKW